MLREEEKGAKSASQLHLLHSCLGTPTEQVGIFCTARRPARTVHVQTVCVCVHCAVYTLLFAVHMHTVHVRTVHVHTVHVTCTLTYLIAYYSL